MVSGCFAQSFPGCIHLLSRGALVENAFQSELLYDAAIGRPQVTQEERQLIIVEAEDTFGKVFLPGATYS